MAWRDIGLDSSLLRSIRVNGDARHVINIDTLKRIYETRTRTHVTWY